MGKTKEDFYNEIEHAAMVARPLFKLFGWTYDGIPNLRELENTIGDLVDGVLKESERPSWDGYSSHASGRFFVSYAMYDDQKELSIKLELSEKSEFKEWQ
jgi:hypothetical protein